MPRATLWKIHMIQESGQKLYSSETALTMVQMKIWVDTILGTEEHLYQSLQNLDNHTHFEDFLDLLTTRYLF